MFKVFMLYEVNPTTWFYLSSLMTMGIFFKFRRVWSVRNLDLAVLSLLAPGMLLISYGYSREGYPFLLTISLLLLVRMLCDPMMVRRPLLDVNLSKGGMVFSCLALVVFLIAGTFLTQWREPTSPQTATMQQLLTRQLNERILESEKETSWTDEVERMPQVVHGTGLPFFTWFADAPRNYLLENLRYERSLETLDEEMETATLTPPRFPVRLFWLTQLVVVLGQLGIVVGMILVGTYHFENFSIGVAAATLYLLLPYSAQIPARIDHIVPAALLVWAIFSYRLPSLAGVLIGLAAALTYYPIFLIPLWSAFYWNRGLYRFLATSFSTILLLLAIAIPLAGGWEPFGQQLADTLGFIGIFSRYADGIWDPGQHSSLFRIPVITAYVILVLFLAFWPAQKNLGTLLSSSAALMVGAQFCQPFQGGLYMAWFLPLMILVIFRPNLEDRVAMRALVKKRRRLSSMRPNREYFPTS
ncbi:MAG: hypothetical protein Q4D62_13055 [Planctomycetia bacterium]|nr:hypothetical protein [Planctomycetia bacterium]